ncbi:hypothetical protein F5B22DRAFT_653496 [Xylaria bambusicola]|uniref:uncharacterized protein n=1 Tax=Xylaria bambusicola TaxID=326684 RepID=UPI002007C9F3|nr:uncharacterized protein F5B22DRAFT_653496 [Xylaria bambusicola]KAI0521107.1 hypothetical protein F5B22DRAFT_653496 [Xylaria bambusicola]
MDPYSVPKSATIKGLWDSACNQLACTNIIVIDANDFALLGEDGEKFFKEFFSHATNDDYVYLASQMDVIRSMRFTIISNPKERLRVLVPILSTQNDLGDDPFVSRGSEVRQQPPRVPVMRQAQVAPWEIGVDVFPYWNYSHEIETPTPIRYSQSVHCAMTSDTFSCSNYLPEVAPSTPIRVSRRVPSAANVDNFSSSPYSPEIANTPTPIRGSYNPMIPLRKLLVAEKRTTIPVSTPKHENSQSSNSQANEAREDPVMNRMVGEKKMEARHILKVLGHCWQSMSREEKQPW